MLEPIRGENVLDIVLSLQNQIHNQMQFDIKVNSETKNKKKYSRNPHNGKYEDLRKYLVKLHWNNTMRNETAIVCWDILSYEIESIIEKKFPFEKIRKTV